SGTGASIPHGVDTRLRTTARVAAIRSPYPGVDVLAPAAAPPAPSPGGSAAAPGATADLPAADGDTCAASSGGTRGDCAALLAGGTRHWLSGLEPAAFTGSLCARDVWLYPAVAR